MYNGTGPALDSPKSCIERQPQVQDQMEALNKSLHHLEDLMERLEHKLNPVMRLEEPACIGSGTAGEYLVPLADAVNCFKGRTYGVADRVESILSRLEI